MTPLPRPHLLSQKHLPHVGAGAVQAGRAAWGGRVPPLSEAHQVPSLGPTSSLGSLGAISLGGSLGFLAGGEGVFQGKLRTEALCVRCGCTYDLLVEW